MAQKHESITERRLSHQFNNRRRFLAGAAVAAAALSWLIIHYQLLEVKSVSVKGAGEITAEAIIKLADIKYIFQTVKWNGTLPLEIEATEINKNYWTRKVVIDVRSREEYGQWCNFGGRECYWFDRTGVTFKTAPAAGGKIVRVVTGPEEVKLGEKIMPERLFANLVKWLDVLEEVEVAAGRVEVGEETREEAVIRLGVEEVPVYFSLRDEPAGVKRALEALRGDLGRLEYIDLRSPNRVYYKYR